MINCPDCGSTNLSKLGIIWSGRHRKQQYKCNDCGRNTVNPVEIPDNKAELRLKTA